MLNRRQFGGLQKCKPNECGKIAAIGSSISPSIRQCARPPLNGW